MIQGRDVKRRLGSSLSLVGNGAVGKPAVSSTAHESGDLERRRKLLIEELYQQNAQVAENLARQTRHVADLDDDALSKGLWQIQVAVLWFDRELRARR